MTVGDPGFRQSEARGLILIRAADAMLRALGGGETTLLFPGAATGDTADLGLMEAAVEEVTLAPTCGLRIDGQIGQRRMEFLFAASGVARLVELRGSESAQAFFESALGIVHEGELMRIESVAADSFAGTAYIYRVIAVE